ncbi:MAG: hypothetical protein HY673_17285 [Chloroflexi bacterium]|nr:hypothetical protein [Chloroflexota bacterium]
MEQLPLLREPNLDGGQSDNVVRRDGVLLIPEGLDTIPYTHGLHRFPGKFIPNVVRYIFRTTLASAGQGALLDPFCGSGTTLVEAALAGRRFVGKDLDPLAVMMSKAKTTPLETAQVAELEAFWAKHDFSRTDPSQVPDIPDLGHWFSDRAVAELSTIKARCLDLPPLLSGFCLVVFSSVIRRVSKADDQTQKTYVSHTLPKNPPLPSRLFPVFMQRALKAMMTYSMTVPKPVHGVVRCGDSRLDDPSLEYDDILTSPPYIDSIDYVYNQLLEYYWLMHELGFDSYQSVRAFRREPMGARKYRASELTHLETTKYLDGFKDQFNTVCTAIGRTSPEEERVLRSFFLDFAVHLAGVAAQQRPGRFYICIVGNSYIRGVTVPTVEIVTQLFKTLGYRLDDTFRYEIRRHYMKFPRRSNSGKIKTDHVLIFRRLA